MNTIFDETVADVTKFFQGNHLEFDKFVKKVEAQNRRNRDENIPMPSRYDLESELATLIDTWPLEVFTDPSPHAYVVMYNDYTFSYQVVREHGRILYQEKVLSKVLLKDLEPELTFLARSKKENQSSDDPLGHMTVDMFAKRGVNMLLKQLAKT